MRPFHCSHRVGMPMSLSASGSVTDDLRHKDGGRKYPLHWIFLPIIFLPECAAWFLRLLSKVACESSQSRRVGIELPRIENGNASQNRPVPKCRPGPICRAATAKAFSITSHFRLRRRREAPGRLAQEISRGRNRRLQLTFSRRGSRKKMMKTMSTATAPQAG